VKSALVLLRRNDCVLRATELLAEQVQAGLEDIVAQRLGLGEQYFTASSRAARERSVTSPGVLSLIVCFPFR
jgi:hypothetical protein